MRSFLVAFRVFGRISVFDRASGRGMNERSCSGKWRKGHKLRSESSDPPQIEIFLHETIQPHPNLER